jgi:hypothetical protein
VAERWRPAAELEAKARAINAEPWEPLPGMVKRQCPQCRCWFVVLVTEVEATSRCPDCARSTHVRASYGAATRP